MTNKKLYEKIGQEHNLLQTVIERKLQLFGHICRMSDDRKLKILLFGKMDSKNKRGCPHREWTDDIVEWCREKLQQLSHLALDRSNRQKLVKQASDVNGH